MKKFPLCAVVLAVSLVCVLPGCTAVTGTVQELPDEDTPAPEAEFLEEDPAAETPISETTATPDAGQDVNEGPLPADADSTPFPFGQSFSYADFLREQAYLDYIGDGWWYGEPSECEYAVLDIDGDGTEELIITGGDGLGFYSFIVFSRDTQTGEIYNIPIESEAAGGIYRTVGQYYLSLGYSPALHALTFTELNNGPIFNSNYCWTIGDRMLNWRPELSLDGIEAEPITFFSLESASDIPEDVIFSGKKINGAEITEYLPDELVLIDVLGLEYQGTKTNPLWGIEEEYYTTDGISLCYSETPRLFDFNNAGRDDVTLYGFSIGDNIEEAKDVLLKEGWNSLYESDYDNAFLGMIKEEKYYYAFIHTDSDGIITSWSVSDDAD